MKKTSRTFKRFAAITSASLLAACMVAPMAGSAATLANGETGNTITINTTSPVYTHENMAAYQIFAGTWNEEKNNFTVSTWGDGIDVVNFIKALKANNNFVVGEVNIFASIAEEKTAVSAQDVAKIIGTWNTGVQANSGAGVTANTTGAAAKMADTFAKLAVEYKTTNITGTFNPVTEDREIATITGLPDGYYVIADTKAADSDKGDGYSSYTLGLLQVAGDENITVTPKMDYPTVVKKVKEDDVSTDNNYGAGYNDVADWDINTKVPFKLIATLPGNIDEYDHYYLKFNDTLADSFGNPTDFVVTVGSTVLTEEQYDLNNTGNDFTLEIVDLKGLGINITSDTQVTVTYNAMIEEANAVIGLPGQENEVTLTYSNNPNVTGDGTVAPTDTDTTTKDTVIVFTYEIDITKKDGSTGLPIPNAEFILSKEENGTKFYATVDSAGKFLGWETTESSATTLKSGPDGVFKIIGIDDGEYSLKELNWSTEYNIPTTPFTVNINATTLFDQEYKETEAKKSADNMLTGLEATLAGEAMSVDANKGIVSGEIENNRGTQLPSTGGIGTTVFYLGGGAMVAVAGIYLISKKRMKNTQE